MEVPSPDAMSDKHKTCRYLQHLLRVARLWPLYPALAKARRRKQLFFLLQRDGGSILSHHCACFPHLFPDMFDPGIGAAILEGRSRPSESSGPEITDLGKFEGRPECYRAAVSA
eukprot:2073377-Ditylum_brightwellii.AAC.1